MSEMPDSVKKSISQVIIETLRVLMRQLHGQSAKQTFRNMTPHAHTP